MSEKSRTLADLSIGQSGYVRIVNGDGGRRRRIIDMGITPGTEIKIIKAAPMGDPIEIAMRGYSLSLRREDAQRIELLTDGEAKELRPYFPPETWSSRRRAALPTVRTRMRLITAVQQ